LVATLIGGVALENKGLAGSWLTACCQGARGLLEEGDDLAAAAG